MKQTLAVGLIVTLLAPSPTFAQGIPVFDVANLAQLVTIADQAIAALQKLTFLYETATRLAKGLGPMDQYRMAAIPTFGHDSDRFEFARPWLEALNTGDARGGKYFETVLKTTRDVGVINSLPPDAAAQLRAAYATIEILDSVAMMGGHQSAIVRGYSGKLQDMVGLLENLVVGQGPGMHELTAVLDKVAIGEVVSRRQDMAGNQLLSNSLEQLLAGNVRKRNTEVLNLNGRLIFMRNNGDLSRSNVEGAPAALNSWRQP